MAWLGAGVAVALMMVVLLDAFEAVILPRRVRHAYRLTRLYMRSLWCLWRAVARWLPAGRWRNSLLANFGPLSLLSLLAVWAVGLITAFGLLYWSLGTALKDSDGLFLTYLYFSGTTFFTLGYGDLVASGLTGRALSVMEAGLGFGFLAVIISYLPVIYQAFSRREITISLLDARAGSPPTAGELLHRMALGRSMGGVGALLNEWERWAAELLESHLSYPVLSFYRSQHDNQSWVAALTAILDTSALLIAAVEGPDSHQARVTFAMARHAAVDLALAFETPPLLPEPDRLAEADLARLAESLRQAGLALRDGAAVGQALAELRALYEPFVNALAAYFLFPLPPFQPAKPPVDNWQTSPWTRRSPGLVGLPAARGADDHFD
jgi:hypothetical protein